MTEIPVYISDFIQSLYHRDLQHETVLIYQTDIYSFNKWVTDSESYLSYEEWSCMTVSIYDEYFTYLRGEKRAEMNIKRIASSLNALLSYYKIAIRLTPVKENRTLQHDNFVSQDEIDILMTSIYSNNALNYQQIEFRYYLADRNAAIVMLIYKYGLTLREVTQVNIQDINFGQNELEIKNKDGLGSRILKLEDEDKKLLLKYYTDIPLGFKPIMYSRQPFFITFDSRKGTYHFDYAKSSPKRLQARTIQGIILSEAYRSPLDRPVTVSHLRNSAILNKIMQRYSNKEIKAYFGLKSDHALLPYKKYLRKQKSEQE